MNIESPASTAVIRGFFDMFDIPYELGKLQESLNKAIGTLTDVQSKHLQDLMGYLACTHNAGFVCKYAGQDSRCRCIQVASIFQSIIKDYEGSMSIQGQTNDARPVTEHERYQRLVERGRQIFAQFLVNPNEEQQHGGKKLPCPSSFSEEVPYGQQINRHWKKSDF